MNSRGGGGTTAASIANSPLIKRVPQSECSAEAGAWEVRAAGRMLIAVLVRPCNTPTAPPASSRWLGFPDQAQHGLPADIHPHVAENVLLGSSSPPLCAWGQVRGTRNVPYRTYVRLLRRALLEQRAKRHALCLLANFPL